MQRVLYIAAPLVAAAALEFRAGGTARTKNIGSDVSQASFQSPVTGCIGHPETRRGGFGESLGAVLLGGAAAALILTAGG